MGNFERFSKKISTYKGLCLVPLVGFHLMGRGQRIYYFYCF